MEKLEVFAIYNVECIGKDGKVKWSDKFRNLIPTVGKNKILDSVFNGNAVTSWYVGLKNDGAAANGDTMASHSGWNELTPYSDGTRKALTLGSISGGSVSNTASKASFAINATASVGGAFVSDNDTKGGSTGTLLSAGNFAEAKSVEDGDTLNVTVTFNVS